MSTFDKHPSQIIIAKETKSIGKSAIARKWRKRSIFFDLFLLGV